MNPLVKSASILMSLAGGLSMASVAEVSTPAVKTELNAPLALSLMPRDSDHTSMWWAEGFPHVVKGAPWVRCIETGNYAFHLNTETLEITHLAGLVDKVGYEDAADIASSSSKTLNKPAGLKLSLMVDGKQYRCKEGGKWSRFTGPRVIDSGRFVQRADVTDLVFVASDGAVLNTEARFETIAWPDRLGFILAVRPAVVNAEAKTTEPAEKHIEKRAKWKDVALGIELTHASGVLKQENLESAAVGPQQSAWRQVALSFDPVTMKEEAASSEVQVNASELQSGVQRKVEFQPSLGWHRVDLDGVVSKLPAGSKLSLNNAAERIRVELKNPSDLPQVARLMFAKTSKGFRHGMGSAITGVSMTMRDKSGQPMGIPVQLSKNWHGDERGGVYVKSWLHGITQLRLPAKSEFELELMITYGHWGGVAAASHAQLSLIGWGSNQLWEQSALGAWGETICYEPSQAQANCTITDVRPLMVSYPGKKNHWKWTVNVGGGDFFRMFDTSGKRIGHSAMQATRHRQGPCLTEVSYSGELTDGVNHSATVSLARTDDMVRGFYRIRLNVEKATDFSRLVLFQVGADTYNFTLEKKLAMGNAAGVLKQWDAQWGGGKYRTAPLECKGESPWVSMHQAERPWTRVKGPWANRGIIIRSWKARLGGKEAAPWVAEHGGERHRQKYSTIDLVPPAGVTRLEPGDYVDAVIEHIILPQSAQDYYGPNAQFRAALEENANSWKMVQREAAVNNPKIVVKQGTLLRKFPDVRIRTEKGSAQINLSGGLGYIPLTFVGLPSHDAGQLLIDGEPLDQSVHGNDFWQSDYDPRSQSWSRTYNIPANPEVNTNSNIQFIFP